MRYPHQTHCFRLRDLCGKVGKNTVLARGGEWLQGESFSRYNRADTRRNSQRLLSHAQDLDRFTERESRHGIPPNHPQMTATGKRKHQSSPAEPNWVHQSYSRPGSWAGGGGPHKTKRYLCRLLLRCHFISCWYAACFKCNFVFQWAFSMCFLDFVSYFIAWLEREKEHELG